MTSYKPKVLVVDDDTDALVLLKHLLEAKGFFVETAAGVREMMQKFNAACDEGLPCFDLVIMDVDLPRVSGLGMLKAIRQVHPTLPVFLLTGYDLSLVKVRAKQLNARYFVKPLADVEGFLDDALNTAVTFNQTKSPDTHAKLMLPDIAEEIFNHSPAAA